MRRIGSLKEKVAGDNKVAARGGGVGDLNL